MFSICDSFILFICCLPWWWCHKPLFVHVPDWSNSPMGSTFDECFPMASSPNSRKPAAWWMEVKHSMGQAAQRARGKHKCFIWCMAGLFSPPHHRVNTNHLPVWRTWMRAQGSFQHSHALCSAVYSLARHPAARFGSESPCCAGESQSCHSGWCIWVPFAGDRQVLDIVLRLLQCPQHCVPWLSSELPTLQELRSCMELGARNKIRSLPLLGSQTQTKTFI